MLHQLREAIPSGVTVLSVPTPPEILSTYRIDRDHLATPDFAIDFEPWLAQQAPYDGPVVPQPSNMIYTSGTTGNPKGVRRDAPTPGAERGRGADARDDLWAEARRACAAAGTALSLRAQFIRPPRRRGWAARL